MLAITEAYHAGLLRPKNYGSNLVAGIVVGVVALPLAMAFAVASGVKPEQGLYTAIVAAFVVGIFGGSRVQIAGPTGAFIIILAHITAQYGINGLQMASLMAGFILIGMGIIKLGNAIKFIPAPVIVGFTTGIGVIIFVGEWKDFFGLSAQIPLDAHFFQKLVILFKAIPSFNIATFGLACLSLFLVLMTPKVLKPLPGPLVAMVVATFLQMIFHFKSVTTIGSVFGGIPEHLPHWHLPSLPVKHSLNLIGAAFTIALLGAIESLLSATAADAMTGVYHDANQELIGQGLANIVTPLWGGFAATGAIARTATNIRNGGNSPLAAIVHSGTLILVIVLLAPYAHSIPLCSLAAILFVVAYQMSDVPHFMDTLKHAPYYDVVILITTFSLTVFTNVVIAVNVGMILAMLFFIHRMNQSVVIEEQAYVNSQRELTLKGLPTLPKDTAVYTFHGPFFFGTAEKIKQAFAINDNPSKTIVFRLKNVPFMDMTGLETFNQVIKKCNQQGIKIYICEANQRIVKKWTHMGILKFIEGKKIFNTGDVQLFS